MAMTRESTSKVNSDSWVDQHGDCLYRYALIRVRHPEAAEDLVQETLFAAVRTSAKFRGTSSEQTWLYGILKNKIIDYFRKLAQEVAFTDLEFLEDEMSHKFIDQGWDHKLGPTEWKPEPEAALDRKEFWETFRGCLDKLPPRVADVFVLREMEQMATAQICEALQISQNNLWVMLHRARMALRECLELNWFERKPRLDVIIRPMSGVDKSSSPPDNPSLVVGRNWIERLLVSFIADHTPKCREVVKLLSQSMELRLPMSTRIKLRFHFLLSVPGVSVTKGSSGHCATLPLRPRSTSISSVLRLSPIHRRNG
jgi:RNA polymerase sigma-70 factor (TIGR02943 family)